MKRERIDMIVVINGTSCPRHYEGKVVSSQLWDGGRSFLWLEDGSDDVGPVKYVHNTFTQEIIRRPIEK